MICLETRHFKVNRTLLLIIGLWPYKRSLIIRLQLILLFGTLISFITFQFTTFITLKCTSDHILKVFSTTFFYMCLAIKYNSFWVNNNIIKSLLEQLQDVCNGLKDENEVAIIKKYGKKGNQYTNIIILFAIMGEGVITFIELWPYIKYKVLHNNESGLNPSTYIVKEYFIDQEKYFFLILVHTLIASYIGSIAMVATGTMLIAYLQHTCGMFSIASYRIEQAINMLQNDILKSNKQIYKDISYAVDFHSNKKDICKMITYAVDIHRRAMEITDFLISNFEGSFFFLIVIGVTCLSLNLFRASSNMDNIEQLILPILFIIILYVYLFLSNHTAQDITDHNEYVFATVYNVQWYVAPIHIQKMMLFLLQRGTKAFHMILGGIFVASMESAATLMSTSISYFTVLYSTKN